MSPRSIAASRTRPLDPSVRPAPLGSTCSSGIRNAGIKWGPRYFSDTLYVVPCTREQIWNPSVVVVTDAKAWLENIEDTYPQNRLLCEVVTSAATDKVICHLLTLAHDIADFRLNPWNSRIYCRSRRTGDATSWWLSRSTFPNLRFHSRRLISAIWSILRAYIQFVPVFYNIDVESRSFEERCFLSYYSSF